MIFKIGSNLYNTEIGLPRDSPLIRVKPPEPMKIIFLFGAGTSVPAGIPSIEGLTKGFLNEYIGAKRSDISLLKRSEIHKIMTLRQIASSQFGSADLESMMSLIVKLENKKFKETLRHQYRDLKNIGVETLARFKDLIQNYIRTKCEKIKDVDYFWALDGLLIKDKPLSIFTLNYDGVIEIYCQKRNIPYTDGFDPFWNLNNFNKKYPIHLFKLHGSLYWFKSGDGIFIKVPIKGLKIQDMRYLTDESVSEMMIYPELEKNKQAIVYSSLFQKFRDGLNQSDVCVIIGYSFRDLEIRDSILEALSSNPNLWLIVVSHKAFEKKNKFFQKNAEFASKIVVMNMGVEEALGERKLHSYLQNLEEARRLEKVAQSMQSKNEDRLDSEWIKPIKHYLTINHHDRIKWLIELLLKNKFPEGRSSFSFTIDAVLCPFSIRYMFDYYKAREKTKLMIWKKFFLESCTLVEYAFFHNNVNLRDHNPVKPTEIPPSYRNPDMTSDYIIEKLKTETRDLLTFIIDNNQKDCLSKLLQTCELITLKKNIREDGGGYNPVTPQEILDGYKNNNLGIRKWALEFVNSLK